MSTSQYFTKIGGVPQFLSCKGTGPQPVLFVHGGPGASLLVFSKGLGKKTALERDCTLVYWEQRGTGRSRGALKDSDLSLETIVEDAIEVATHIRQRFARPPVVVGHSWGTIVGVHLAARRPDLVRAYIGVGQVVNVLEQERRSTAWAFAQAQSAKDGDIVRALERLGPLPHSAQEMLAQRKVLARYGGVWRGLGSGALERRLLAAYLFTSEYGLLDLWREARDPLFSLRALMKDKLTVNLGIQVPKLDVPVSVIAGVHDQITPLALVEQYLAQLEAPGGKELLRFERSAHYAFLEEPERFEEVIRKRLKGNTYN